MYDLLGQRISPSSDDPLFPTPVLSFEWRNSREPSSFGVSKKSEENNTNDLLASIIKLPVFEWKKLSTNCKIKSAGFLYKFY